MGQAEADLERAVREAGPRIQAALAVQFNDLDGAEEAFAQACVSALPAWRRLDSPRDPAAWLYAVARRRLLDAGRRARVRHAANLDPPEPAPTPESLVIGAFQPIPDERLRLIFACCHPALSLEARVALTLRTLCGLSAARIARAFLTTEAAIIQRLTRARRKIREARIPFEIPTPDQWGARLEAVLATLEIAYGQAYEQAIPQDGGALGEETVRLTGVLAELLPHEPEVLGLAALARLAESRRAARLRDGVLQPLDQQDVRLWDRDQIRVATALLRSAAALGRTGPRQILATIHAAHVSRMATGVTPWSDIASLYDGLVLFRPDPVVEVHQALAWAESGAVEAACSQLLRLAGSGRLADYRPLSLVTARVLELSGETAGALAQLDLALAGLEAGPERNWLEGWQRRLAGMT